MMEKASSLRLDVACNNPDNGLFAWKAEMLQVVTWDGGGVEFACVRRAPLFREVSGGIRIFRRTWQVSKSTEWYGNWCWNAYWLHPEILATLLYMAKKSGMFHCEAGPSDLYENWNSPADFNRDLWLANLWGQHSVGVVS